MHPLFDTYRAGCARGRDTSAYLMYLPAADVPSTALSSVAILVCLLAAILVFRLKLHKKVVYRLALYQVLASLAFAAVETLEIIFIHDAISGQLCAAVGFFSLYTRWTKLLFTMWVTFHLFCFGVLGKDMKKLEVWYVVTSLLVPALIAVVPLTTKTYQLSPYHTSCYISTVNDTDIEFGEKLALWDIPAILILMVSSFAMTALVIKIAKLLCKRSKYKPITAGGQFWKALKELLPLAAFPMLFFVFIIPSIIYHIYSSIHDTPPAADKAKTISDAIVVTSVIFTSLWSIASGATLITHILMARCFKKKVKNGNNELSATYSGLKQSA